MAKQKETSGYFYFRRTLEGKLAGKYSNNTIITAFPEIASPTANDNKIDGTYETHWTNGKNDHENGILKIEPKKGGNKNHFALTWTKNKKTVYTGEAMMMDDMLIGSYEKIEE